MERKSHFESLGRALRLLRLRRGHKQYEVARSARITKAMLSAYETGKRLPSLATLGAILEALASDLGDLHRAMLADRHEGEIMAERAPGATDSGNRLYPPSSDSGLEVWEPPDLYRVLGGEVRLPPGQERAFAEMLHGFHALLRYLNRRLADLG
jgi:transcriptional regulator with XRE-family HTH domain